MPSYKDLTLLQQTFLSLCAGNEIVMMDNIDTKLQAIAEAIGIEFKEKQ